MSFTKHFKESHGPGKPWRDSMHAPDFIPDSHFDAKMGVEPPKPVAVAVVNTDGLEDTIEIKIGKEILHQISDMNEITRGSQCKSLRKAIEYRVGNITKLAHKLLAVHAKPKV